MLVHSVYFWLKEDVSAEKFEAFREGLESLGRIETTQAIYIGTPAETADRPVVDRSYSIAATVVFASMADHDAYQEHALHKAFLDNFADYWRKLVIYDAD